MFLATEWQTVHIGLDKSGYQVNSFLDSQQKHILWVLIRRASVRHFLCVPTTCVLIEKNA